MKDQNLSEMSLEELEQQKIDARMKLLAMNPEDAQELVNQVFLPHLWKPVDLWEWEESLEPEQN